MSRAFSLAGFEVTLIGRFWVTTEGNSGIPKRAGCQTALQRFPSVSLLTRVEDAFRDIKSPLMERPIFHHLQNRTQS